VVNLIDMALMQGDENRLLVGEVLIDRTDTYPRNLGNPICCDGTNSLALQDPHDSIEYCLNRLLRSTLLGPASV
jgi:hypothetical protein